MKGGPLKLCLSKFDFSGPPPPVLYDQSLIVIAIQTKHAGILETTEKYFKYLAPKACKVALRSDFVEK